MARKLIKKIKPDEGYSHAIYIIFRALLPILVLFIARTGFPIVAVALVLLSKWRIFAVKPRYWLPNIRSNAVDMFIGLSVVAFIAGTDLWVTQIIWTVFYIFWLVWLKPRSDAVSVIAQALAAQVITLVAFYRAFPEQSILAGVIVAWIVCYSCARHFFTAFNEPLTRPMTHIWAWFGAVMAWILGHWVIQYLFLPQIAIILTVIGYGLATLYYLNSNERLKTNTKRQLISVVGLLLLFIIVISDWQDKTI